MSGAIRDVEQLLIQDENKRFIFLDSIKRYSRNSTP